MPTLTSSCATPRSPGPAASCVPAARIPRGPHDVDNALAATAAAVTVGARPRIATTLAGWTNLPHRVQLVASMGGVDFVDDSKATNAHATASVLDDLEHVVLLAVGATAPATSMPSVPYAPHLRAVVAIGEAARRGRVGLRRPGAGRARRRRCTMPCAPQPHGRSRATPCSSRRRARRSTGTRATQSAATTSPARCERSDGSGRRDGRHAAPAARGAHRAQAVLVRLTPRTTASVGSSTPLLIAPTVAVLNIVGIVMVLSASSVASLTDYGSPWHFFLRQLLWTLLGLAAFVVGIRLDYRKLRSFVRPLLIVERGAARGGADPRGRCSRFGLAPLDRRRRSCVSSRASWRSSRSSSMQPTSRAGAPATSATGGVWSGRWPWCSAGSASW